MEKQQSKQLLEFEEMEVVVLQIAEPLMVIGGLIALLIFVMMVVNSELIPIGEWLFVKQNALQNEELPVTTPGSNNDAMALSVHRNS